VDIISMSFGFEKPNAKIRDAINIVPGKVIMFAAAGNHGGLKEGESFPASLASVISIRAADGQGVGAGFNPSSHEDRRTDHLSTLGECVMSMWRVHDQLSGLRIFQKRVSGSSTATPIAAAITALVLEFLSQPDDCSWHRPLLKLSRELLDEMNRREGMKLLLQDAMSLSIHGDLVITPWLALKSEPEEGDVNQVDSRFKAASKIFNSLDR
jgi:hypothetical protein